MSKNGDKFSLEELSALTDTAQRTIRFYIQEGLVDRPHGAKRGAYYSRRHLEQLLTIRKWQKAGLSLERIRELVAEPESGEHLPPARRRKAGDVSVRSHILLAPGVELAIEPGEAGLTAEEVRELARKTAALLDRSKKGNDR